MLLLHSAQWPVQAIVSTLNFPVLLSIECLKSSLNSKVQFHKETKKWFNLFSENYKRQHYY